MAELTDEDDLETPPAASRWKWLALVAARAVPSAVSIGCAAMAGYFTYLVINTEPPGDLSKLAVSILQSPDASPQMRAWAATALGIQSDIPMDVSTGSVPQRKLSRAQPLPPKVSVTGW